MIEVNIGARKTVCLINQCLVHTMYKNDGHNDRERLLSIKKCFHADSFRLLNDKIWRS